MKPYLAILSVALFCLLGCASQKPESPITFEIKDPVVVATADSFRHIAMPLPETTPYDSDARKRQAYLSGFREGWDRVACGGFLYATYANVLPSEKDLRESWITGQKTGSELAFQRWQQEQAKVLKEMKEK